MKDNASDKSALPSAEMSMSPSSSLLAGMIPALLIANARTTA
jgi:hypothetical protein